MPTACRTTSYLSALNLLKGGIVYSNFVTTVSPHHAWEAMNTDQGLGWATRFGPISGKFGGVLNGVDYDAWNPEIDPHIARRYTIESLDRKYENKRALRERFWLRDDLQADRGLHRAARQPERRPSGAARAVLFAVERGSVRAARTESRIRRSTAISGISSII